MTIILCIQVNSMDLGVYPRVHERAITFLVEVFFVSEESTVNVFHHSRAFASLSLLQQHFRAGSQHRRRRAAGGRCYTKTPSQSNPMMHPSYGFFELSLDSIDHLDVFDVHCLGSEQCGQR